MAKAATVSTRLQSGSRRGWAEQVLVGILLLAVAVAGVVVFLVAAGLVAAEELIANESLRAGLLGFAQGGSATERAVTASASAVIGLGSLLLLFRRAGDRTDGAGSAQARHILVADDEGMVMVSTAGIASVAETAAVRSHGVLEADVKVGGRGSAPVRIRVVAYAYRGADLKRAGREVRENVKSAVERLVGLDVTDVTVEIEVSEEELGRGVA